MNEKERPRCKCGNLCKHNGFSKKDNRRLYNTYCSPCARRKHDKKFAYRKHLKDACEKCGFIPEHVCQLDIDHIDGNHANNATSNLQTLCANCHRLKTFHERDWEPI